MSYYIVNQAERPRSTADVRAEAERAGELALSLSLALHRAAAPFGALGRFARKTARRTASGSREQGASRRGGRAALLLAPRPHYGPEGQLPSIPGTFAGRA